MFEFTTIESAVSEILLKEKGSKFIGYLLPVTSEKEVKTQLEKLKELHPKATHHCYAYRLGSEGKEYRANDDGEPSGSAGLPILNQLLANEITNALLVVIRYYGGTKLGVSGLIKAYKETAKEAISQAVLITKEQEILIDITFPFALQNLVFTILNKHFAKISDFKSGETCTITASIKVSQKKSIENTLLDQHQIKFKFQD